MKVTHLLLVALVVVTLPASAKIVPALISTHPTNLYLSPDIPLSPSEKAGVALAKKWMNKKTEPITAGDGSVTYFYGAVMPTAVCSPNNVCDIQLQAGEKINKNGLNASDTVRWSITPMLSGQGEQQTTHVIVKPSDAGLSGNLVIGTDRRTYNIKLVSRADDWMPTIKFDYPEPIQQTLDTLYAREQTQKAHKQLGNGLNIDDLDFNYKTEGRAPFVPVRVYNNSLKTIIEMPRSVATGKLPSLVVVNGGRHELINYRYRNNQFIVDGLPNQIMLLLGTGKYQQSVLISRKGA
ncbi:P-type conjugative transfer protein TrbG [Photobacterium leiognathi]|uniref:P-type conjugative transfer protein TrbG n=1 Tax=Photobacterium leiognathi TaxID=553611 RepID=UPI002739249F|nr:P-type conjugative transfer protein TrbG [Photobacterium leiognathi]